MVRKRFLLCGFAACGCKATQQKKMRAAAGLCWRMTRIRESAGSHLSRVCSACFAVLSSAHTQEIRAIQVLPRSFFRVSGTITLFLSSASRVRRRRGSRRLSSSKFLCLRVYHAWTTLTSHMDNDMVYSQADRTERRKIYT